MLSKKIRRAGRIARPPRRRIAVFGRALILSLGGIVTEIRIAQPGGGEIHAFICARAILTQARNAGAPGAWVAASRRDGSPGRPLGMPGPPAVTASGHHPAKMASDM